MENRINNWVIPVLFLMVPFVFLYPGLLWTSQHLFFIILPIIIVAFLIENIWIKSFLLYITGWQIWMYLQVFNDPRSNPGIGLSIIISLMSGAIIFLFVSKGRWSVEKWFKIIRIAVILQIIICIPQLFWKYNVVFDFMSLFTKMVNSLPDHLVGTLGNRNFLSAFIAVSIPAFVGWRTITIRGITVNPALIVIGIILYFCYSPGTLAGLIGAAFFYTYKIKNQRTRWLLFSLGPILAVAYSAYYILSTGYHVHDFTNLPDQLRELLTGENITFNEINGDLGRFSMWLMAFAKLMKSWTAMIFGFGPGAFWGRPYPLHSEYMWVWFQFGLIGLGLMVGYIWTTARFLIRSHRILLLTSFIIICLDMVANFPMEIPPPAFLIIIIAALIEREKQQWHTRLKQSCN